MIAGATDVASFVSGALARLRIAVRVSDEDLARIPASGPLLLAGNHPFGGIEGIALAGVLGWEITAVESTTRGLTMKALHGTGTCRRLVLAVDDEEDHLLAYAAAFDREPDLRLITAATTRAAEAALERDRVDAVLLDLAIPEDGGLDLCRRIKAQPRFRHLPVIALSALPAAYHAAPALAAGCFAFLQKPCSLAAIVAEVRRGLERGGGA